MTACDPWMAYECADSGRTQSWPSSAYPEPPQEEHKSEHAKGEKIACRILRGVNQSAEIQTVGSDGWLNGSPS